MKKKAQKLTQQDLATLYDLLYVYERLHWRSEVGDKQAQDRIDELHAGKNGDRQGFFVQARDAVNKVRDAVNKLKATPLTLKTRAEN